MATNKDVMIDKINTFFGALSLNWQPSSISQKTDVEDKIYEIYTYALVATEIGKKRKLEIYNGNGKQSANSNFVFRGAPTNLGNPIYSYLEFQKRKKGTTTIKYELHLSLEIEGVSKVKHEMDVCIVEHKAARSTSGTKKLIKYDKVPVTFECKYYKGKDKNDKYREIQKKLGREVLGLNYDTGRTIKGNNLLEGFLIYYENIDQQVIDLLNFYNVTTLNISPQGPDDLPLLKKHIFDLMKLL